MKGGIEVHIGLTIEVEPDGPDGEHTYVRCPQIPGLHCMGKNLPSMRAALGEQIKHLLVDNHKLPVDWLEVFVEPESLPPDSNKAIS